MSFRNVSWRTGDLVDVSRMNQYVANDQYLFDLLSMQTLVNDASDKWVDQFSPNFRIKVDGAYALQTLILADTTPNQYAQYHYYNWSIQALSAGTHTVTECQGTSETVTHSFYKHPEMNYLSFWVVLGNSTPDDTPTYGRRCFTLIGHRDQISGGQ